MQVCVCVMCVQAHDTIVHTCVSLKRVTLGFIALPFYLIVDRVFLVFTAASAMLAGLATARDFLISVPRLTVEALKL